MEIKANNRAAYSLLHEGVRALSVVESNGMRVDMAHLEKTKKRLDRGIKKGIQFLKTSKKCKPIWDEWKKIYGNRAKIQANEQVADVFFNHLGYKGSEETEKGNLKADEASLLKIDHPFIKSYLKLTKYYKARNTYINGIEREVVDGYIHPFFNLHTVKTFRSSSDKPNFQNQPVRDPWMGGTIRRCFIPRKGRVIVELDYSGVEVILAACYHKDPNMVRYIKNPKKDMHRDMAAQCFKLPTKAITKQHRYCGKNQFVFPQFYGDYYINSAISMWDSIDQMDLRGPNDEPLKEWLRRKGVTGRGACARDSSGKVIKALPGTFEKHMQEVENDFWNNRFKVYGRWKRDWYSLYQSRGYFNTLTGFRIGGIMGRNDVINYPVQGAAFHCLLWSLTQAVLHELPKRKMNTKVVGQIHDSIVGDVPVEELGEYLELMQWIMCEKVREFAPWLIANLSVEAEICPVGGTWWDKQEVEFEENKYTYTNAIKEKVSVGSIKQLLTGLAA